MAKKRAGEDHREAPSSVIGGINIISQQQLDPKLSELFSHSVSDEKKLLALALM